MPQVPNPDIPNPDIPNPAPQSPAPRKRPSRTAVLCVVAVLLVATVCGVFYRLGAGEKPVNAPASVSGTPLQLDIPSVDLSTPAAQNESQSSAAAGSSASAAQSSASAAGSSASAGSPAAQSESQSSAAAGSSAAQSESQSSAAAGSSAAAASQTAPQASQQTAPDDVQNGDGEELPLHDDEADGDTLAIVDDETDGDAPALLDGEPADEPADAPKPAAPAEISAAPVTADHSAAFSETLRYNGGSGVQSMNAYDLVCRIVQNEIGGNFAPEAIKAHAVATYTMLKYNNAHGLAPSVRLKNNVSASVEQAVKAVLGQAVYYNGQMANTVYFSTSCGKTTSSKAVWGGALGYLVSVDSSWDSQAPNYQSSYVISSENFAKKAMSVYGLALEGDPAGWITAKRDAPGGYVGTATLGGKRLSGRSVREKLLGFALRSHCFEVEYNEEKDRFEFTVYGYGHGVGMSQYGAHYMALAGYNYRQILQHYYTDTTVK